MKSIISFIIGIILYLIPYFILILYFINDFFYLEDKYWEFFLTSILPTTIIGLIFFINGFVGKKSIVKKTIGILGIIFGTIVFFAFFLYIYNT